MPHLDLALLDDLVGEYLKVVSLAYVGQCSDDPLCGIVLVELDSVSVVRWELVVEVVITLTKCQDGCEDT